MILLCRASYDLLAGARVALVALAAAGVARRVAGRDCAVGREVPVLAAVEASFAREAAAAAALGAGRRRRRRRGVRANGLGTVPRDVADKTADPEEHEMGRAQAKGSK